MLINLNSDKYELSDSQQNYIEEKLYALKKFFQKFTEETIQVKVVVEKNETLEQSRKIILRVTMSVPKALFRAEANAFTVEEGVDLIQDKLTRQIERYKTKHLNFDSNALGEAMLASQPVGQLDGLDEMVLAGVSKRKLFSDLIPMNEKEAIETMTMLGHTFFIFVNSATDRYNILYKRSDEKGFGIIELEHQDGVTT
jgi:ribosomal subunit interface protein